MLRKAEKRVIAEMGRPGGCFNNLAKREFSGDLDQDNSSRSDKKYIF